MNFLMFFFPKNLSIKIVMFGPAFGAVIWLTFFQNYVMPLFFSGLPSYLVGMRRRTVGVSYARDNPHFLHYLEKPVHNATRHFSCSSRVKPKVLNTLFILRLRQYSNTKQAPCHIQTPGPS